jgi:hypothetical protein
MSPIPIIFITTIIDFVLRSCNFHDRVQLNPHRHPYNRNFADNIVIITPFTEHVQQNIKELASKAPQTSLQFNVNKTKAMSNGVITFLAGGL